MTRQTPVILEPVLDTKTPEDIKNIPVMTETGIGSRIDIATLESEERSTTSSIKMENPIFT